MSGALWRRRIVTFPPRRHGPFVQQEEGCGSSLNVSWHVVLRRPRSSPQQQLGDRGMGGGVKRGTATSPVCLGSEWLNVSYTASKTLPSRESDCPLPSEIYFYFLFFCIMQEESCNYTRDLWQRLSRPPTGACRNAAPSISIIQRDPRSLLLFYTELWDYTAGKTTMFNPNVYFFYRP